MKLRHTAPAAAVIVITAVFLIALRPRAAETSQDLIAPPPVLSVQTTQAEVVRLPRRVPASGHIAAWQEASIGAEGEGLRLVAVTVNVGDAVKRGQLLAQFNADIVEAELAEARAAVAQAVAAAQEAEANAGRANTLAPKGALSAQQITQYLAAAKAAQARVEAARAAEQRQRLRLAQTRVLAPSDGIVTSRTATVGAVVPAGQELFRLIRDGRLEWRALVAAGDIDQLAPGQVAQIHRQNQAPIQGELRTVSPQIDTATHNGLVYVDLPRLDALRAGAFVRGHIELGDATALTLPQSAVLLRDGLAVVMRVGARSTVVVAPVALGRRVGDRIEILGGLAESEAVIASGLAFLSEGDTVNVLDAPSRGAEVRRGTADSAPANAAGASGEGP